MKKLMIAAAMVCAAAMSQAAANNWSVTIDDGANLYAPSSYIEDVSDGTPMGGTMYLFYLTEGYNQESVYNALKEGATLASLAAANGIDQSFTIGSNGKLATTTFTGPEAATAYFAVIDAGNDTYLFGMGAEYGYNDITGGAADQDFSWSSYGEVDFRTATSWQSGEIDNIGWYSVASVPEPTSGLLLLLGVAGLALRRRRA